MDASEDREANPDSVGGATVVSCGLLARPDGSPGQARLSPGRGTDGDLRASAQVRAASAVRHGPQSQLDYRTGNRG